MGAGGNTLVRWITPVTLAGWRQCVLPTRAGSWTQSFKASAIMCKKTVIILLLKLIKRDCMICSLEGGKVEGGREALVPCQSTHYAG